MSQGLQQVRDAKLIRTNYKSIEEAQRDIENARIGRVFNSWPERDGRAGGFVGGDPCKGAERRFNSVFLESEGVVYEIRLYLERKEP